MNSNLDKEESDQRDASNVDTTLGVEIHNSEIKGGDRPGNNNSKNRKSLLGGMKQGVHVFQRQFLGPTRCDVCGNYNCDGGEHTPSQVNQELRSQILPRSLDQSQDAHGDRNAKARKNEVSLEEANKKRLNAKSNRSAKKSNRSKSVVDKKMAEESIEAMGQGNGCSDDEETTTAPIIEEPPKVAYFTVLREAVYHSVGGRTHFYAPDAFGVRVSGAFKFPEYGTVSVCKRLLYHDPAVSGAEISTDGFLVLTYQEPNGIGRDDSVYSDVTLERIREAAWSVIDHVTYEKTYSPVMIRKQVKAHYLRFFKPYLSIDSDIRSVVNSQEFTDRYQMHILDSRNNWESRIKARISQTLASEGRDFETEFGKFNFRFGIISACSYGTVTGAMTMPFLFLSRYLKGLARAWARLAALAIGGYNVIQFLVDMEYGNRLRRFSKHIHGLQTGGIVPCANLLTQKCTVPMERRAEIKTPGVKLVKESQDLRQEDMKTEFIESFGTRIPGPLAYPQNNVQNVEAAVRTRMCQSDLGDKLTNREFMRYAKKLINKLDNIDLGVEQPEEVLRHLVSTYGERRGTALYLMRDNPLTHRDLESEVFVKGEAYLGKDSENLRPRMICKQSDLMLAKYSYMFSKLGKALAQRFDRSTDIFYSYASTPDQVGDFVQRIFDESQSGSVYEADVSGFDGSITPTMLKLEKYFLLKKVIGLKPSFDFILENWEVRRLVSKDREVQITMSHGRRSGDLWTSMFNSLLNILITMFVHRLDWDDKPKMIVLGDDSIVGMRKEFNVDDITKAYSDLGMTVKVFRREEISDVTFCSGDFLPLSFGYRYSNLPFRTLAKFGMNHHKHHPNLHKRLLYGTAKSLLPTGGHVPILGAFLRRIVATAEEKNIKAYVDNRTAYKGRIQGGQVAEPDLSTYAAFSIKYGIDVESILELEREIDQVIHIDDFPYVLNGQIFTSGYAQNVDYPDTTMRDELSVILKDSTVDNHASGMDLETHSIINIAPLEEEKWKLGHGSTIQNLVAAYAYGAEEDAAFGTTSHKWLHTFFTSISTLSLTWGVSLHSLYNRFALKKADEAMNKNLMNWKRCSDAFSFNRSAIYPCKNNKNRPRQQKGRNQSGLTMNDLRRLNALSLASGIPTIRGQGGYVGDAARAVGKTIKRRTPKGTFKAIGTAAGGALGGGTGAMIGGLLGQGVSHLVGFGDYSSIKSNSLLAPIQEGVQSPQFANYNHVTVITHTEFVRDITADGGTAFTVLNFPINPGLRESFPWASLVTEGYESWQALGMFYEFRSTSSDITTGGPMGSVIMATSYDSLHADFSDKITMTNTEYSMTGKPSTSFRHYVECDPAITAGAVKYIRSGTNPSGSDERMYDLGNFQIATVGLPTSSGNIGELWVTYQIALYKPTLARKVPSIQDHFDLPITITASHYLGADTTTVYYPTNNSPMGGSCLNSTYLFPDHLTTGSYLFMYKVRGAPTTITTSFTATLTNCSATNFFGNGSGGTPYAGWAAPQSGALACLDIVYSAVVTITAADATIEIAAGTLPGSISGADVLVTQLS